MTDVVDFHIVVAPHASGPNADQRQVQWHFTTNDARTKLRHLYPKR
ncbi:hypothetical protein FAIPA1_350007 [Frankia sp. AiPs1]